MPDDALVALIWRGHFLLSISLRLLEMMTRAPRAFIPPPPPGGPSPGRHTRTGGQHGDAPSRGPSRDLSPPGCCSGPGGLRAGLPAARREGTGEHTWRTYDVNAACRAAAAAAAGGGGEGSSAGWSSMAPASGPCAPAASGLPQAPPQVGVVVGSHSHSLGVLSRRHSPFDLFAPKSWRMSSTFGRYSATTSALG